MKPTSDDGENAPISPNEMLEFCAPKGEPKPQRHWPAWARRLLLCNPFYLCSAALLLLGVNRLSVDQNFLADETQNLLFNFFALKGYGILLMVTALVLVRRRVWYDSALLVVLDNGLLLVPFMLISQASLIGGTLATLLAGTGGVLVCLRVLALRRFYPEFNLPGRVAGLGALIVAGNVVLPRVFRPWIEKDVLDWLQPNAWLWLAVLPGLVAGANALPRPKYSGDLPSQRSWLPLFLYALWTIGTGTHFWCLQHICSLPFNLAQLAPTAWVAAWTLPRRLADGVAAVSPAWERALLVLPGAVPLLALADPASFTALAGANALVYAGLAWRGRAVAIELSLLSMAVVIAGVPSEWMQSVLPFRRAHAVAGAGAFYAMVQALRSSRPELGALGALAIGLITSHWARHGSLHWSAQAGLVFLLLHSLRWDETAHAGARSLRLLAAALWALDGVLWSAELTRPSMMGIPAGAALVLGGWCLRGWLKCDWRGWSFPVASALAAASGPFHWLHQKSSAGIIALVGSLALFALGTITACTRKPAKRIQSGFTAER